MSAADADEVLFHALRSSGIDVHPSWSAIDDVVNDVDDESSANTNALLNIVRQCLCLIDATAYESLPRGFPLDDGSGTSVAERFRVAGRYASALIEVGGEQRDGDGFQQFLYPSASSARAMLKRLLELLPRRDVDEAVREAEKARVSAASARLGSRARAMVARSTKAEAAWGRAAGALKGFAGVAAAARAKKRTDDATNAREFYTSRLTTSSSGGFFGNMSADTYAVPSVLEYAARMRAEAEAEEDARRLKFSGVVRAEFIGPDGKPFDLRKRGGLRGLVAEIFRLALEGGFYTEPRAIQACAELEETQVVDEDKVVESVNDVENAAMDTLEDRIKARERDLEDVHRRIDEAMSVVSTVDDEIAACASKVKEAMEATDAKRALTAELESNYLLHKQAVGMVLATDRPVEESEAELNKVLVAAKERLEQLSAEWNAAKTPLLAAIEAHAEGAREKRKKAKNQLEEIEKWRSEGKDTSSLLRIKEQEQRQLLDQYEAAPKSVHRPSFVRRVNEIIKNIKKQEREIVKIVGDTRSVQSDINSAQACLERTYTVVEEILFREARSDELCRAAYKHLHGMHAGFADLIDKVEATGVARRSQTDLQRKLVEISKQPSNVERVARDLELMKRQIAELEEKLSTTAA